MVHLTPEQQVVIQHPVGSHARVLAVAGAGKTTTMAHRVQHLLNHERVVYWRIGLLMFNRLARGQFESRLDTLELPENKRPRVHTFHSFAYQVVHDAIRHDVCAPIHQKWFSDQSEQARWTVLRLIQQFERQRYVAYQSLDPEEVLMAISLWKGALIPPERAGYRGSNVMPALYMAFEEERLARGAVTFDDLIPMTVKLLETEPLMQHRWRKRFQHLIVDEYQDVNYGQQRLIELLAGKHADLMVVGDDDQTIYAWRGARPDYLIRGFKSVFDHKPIIDYTLSHSFRFGPLIAQCAENVVGLNVPRVDKPVIAHNVNKNAQIKLIRGEPDGMQAVNEQLADIAQDSLKQGEQLIVLGRLYSQMTGVELAFLTRQQPYRVEGNAPLLERREIVALTDYVRLAQGYQQPVTESCREWLLSTANTPNRKLRKDDLHDAVTLAAHRQQPIKDMLAWLADPDTTPFGYKARTAFDEYADTIDLLHDALHENAGAVLKWLVRHIGYEDHFDDYYGGSETAEDRKRAVAALVRYATSTDLSLQDFMAHFDALDTTHGAPEAEQIVLTSIHRVKGLEYDTVILPDCILGYMPCLIDADSPIFDTAGQITEPDIAPGMDDERRLFYVALTRARQRVVVGTVRYPLEPEFFDDNFPLSSLFLDEMGLEDTQPAVDALQNGNYQTLIDHLKGTPFLYGLATNAVKHYLPTLNATTATDDLRDWLNATPPPKLDATMEMDEDNTGHELLAVLRNMTQQLADLTLSDGEESSSTRKHPRAYQRWTDEEENLMMTLLNAGKSIKEVAEALQRQPSAIRSRKKKVEERTQSD